MTPRRVALLHTTVNESPSGDAEKQPAGFSSLDEQACFALLSTYCRQLCERYPEFAVLQAAAIILERLTLSLL